MRTNAIVGLSMALVAAYCRLAPAQSRGPTPEPTFVVGSSHCPELSSVASVAIRLTPVKQRSIYASGVRVQVDDLGEHYQVSVFAPGLLASKTYIDPGRDCARRTTFAAVLVFMTLMPPQLAEEPLEGNKQKAPANLYLPAAVSEPKATVPSPALRTQPTETQASQPIAPREIHVSDTRGRAPSLREPWARVSLGVAASVVPPLGDSLSAMAWGLALQISAGSRSLAPFVGFTYASSSNFELTGISANIRRWPMAAGLEWRNRLSTFDVNTALGAVAVFERVQGRELWVNQSQSTVELGSRISVSASWFGKIFSPFISVAVDAFPAPRAVSSVPRGHLGTTPLVEIWNTLGVRINL